MTTPAPAAPTISLSTDKTTYNTGDPLTLTVTYADAQSQPVQLTITATATDAQGNTATGTAVVTVTEQETEAMTVSATDSFNDSYSLVSNDGKGTAVLSTTVGTPPAS
jgi:hypothetical protein